MLIGVPKEIKPDEYRVALTPAGAEMLSQDGHNVVMERGAGLGSGFTDDFYAEAGVGLLDTADEVWTQADMIIKVKEPIHQELPHMRDGQVIFTYFHFAADESLTRACLEAGVVAIAYETVKLSSGELPLLTPMSEVAGRMAVQEGARYLEKPQGGLGILLGGVPGVLPGKVLILGGGVVGTNAAKMAAGLGSRVHIMDIDLERLRALDFRAYQIGEGRPDAAASQSSTLDVLRGWGFVVSPESSVCVGIDAVIAYHEKLLAGREKMWI